MTNSFFNITDRFQESIPETVLLAESDLRKKLIKEISTIIAENSGQKPFQNVALIGDEGTGKTTILKAIAYTIKKNVDLSENWFSLPFTEENYGVGDLADFWLEALRLIEAYSGVKPGKSKDLLVENPPDLAEKAQKEFLNLLSKTEKKAILLLDNFDNLINAISDKNELDSLKEFLTKTDLLMVIVSSSQDFRHLQGSQKVEEESPYNFKFLKLESYDKSKAAEAIRMFAKRQNDSNILNILEKEPERINIFAALTGGTPRLTRMLYQIWAEKSTSNAYEDIYRLLEIYSADFKRKIDHLKTQPRRLLNAIALHYDPQSVGELSVFIRKPSNYVSSQINRLVKDGFVEKSGGTEKRKLYRIKDRLFNIYYLVRYSPAGQSKLLDFIAFMELYYKTDRFQKAISITDAPEMNKKMVQTIDTVMNSKAARGKLKDHCTIAELLENLTPNQLKAIDYKAKEADWWLSMALALIDRQFYDLAEQSFRQAIQLSPKNSMPYCGLANLLNNIEGRHNAAREFAIQGLSLSPESGYAQSIFLKTCLLSSNAWLKVLPKLFVHLEQNPQDKGIYQFVFNGLVRLTLLGESREAIDLIEFSEAKPLLEPLLLAIKSRSDKKILDSLALERREMVLEVLEQMK